MKGQVFLIISIVVLLALILIKIQVTPEPRQAYYLGLDIWKSADNIAEEYEKTADISLSQSSNYQNLETNLNNFSNYIYNSFNEREYSLRILYSTMFAGENLTVTLGNFMGSPVYNITVNLSDGQGASISELPTNMSASINFTLPSLFNVTVQYTMNGTESNFSYASDNNVTLAAYVRIYLQQGSSVVDVVRLFNKTASYS